MRRGARIEIHGTVQGVGFRPFVHRLASEIGLDGWILNDANGVFIEVDGDESSLDAFVRRLRAELPAVAAIDELTIDLGDVGGHDGFHIRHSDGTGRPTAIILPDLATCADCLNDIMDADDRRTGYAFTNCTNCGPRYSIITDLPYDRPNTTMAAFTMCAACRAEYDEPTDRRFHAQPTACPRCGPHLTWGHRRTQHDPASPDDEVLAAAVAAIGEGAIVALKGVGGYQLIVDATDEEAVARLRARKHRPTKPLAVMVRDLEQAARIVHLSETERSVLTAPQAPIVLADRRADSAIAPSVAPGNPRLGVMLPTTPLHHLLCGMLTGPVVATSGNRDRRTDLHR